MLEKHSLTLAGHRTSITLEPAFWRHVKRMAAQKQQTLTAFITDIDEKRGEANLSSALRLAVLADVEGRL
jgi:predicted DNA-binding ribbon-helix-helix protein